MNSKIRSLRYSVFSKEGKKLHKNVRVQNCLYICEEQKQIKENEKEKDENEKQKQIKGKEKEKEKGKEKEKEKEKEKGKGKEKDENEKEKEKENENKKEKQKEIEIENENKNEKENENENKINYVWKPKTTELLSVESTNYFTHLTIMNKESQILFQVILQKKKRKNKNKHRNTTPTNRKKIHLIGMVWENPEEFNKSEINNQNVVLRFFAKKKKILSKILVVKQKVALKHRLRRKYTSVKVNKNTKLVFHVLGAEGKELFKTVQPVRHLFEKDLRKRNTSKNKQQKTTNTAKKKLLPDDPNKIQTLPMEKKYISGSNLIFHVLDVGGSLSHTVKVDLTRVNKNKNYHN
ncbi:chascon [Anaeramoeba flamelloides]|uniref:Chascon n=1 Tax=Anaeramoeba flamelloides TaxID=1746091 RepID=A0ABQ8XM56_9EUKA|nr:chascon [Anaeramoeba flamelloides]